MHLVGSEFKVETPKEYLKKEKEEEIQYKLPFGGGSGAGVSINPIAFLVIQEDKVKLLPVTHESAIDKLLDYVPELIEKTSEIIDKKMNMRDEKKKDIERLIKDNLNIDENIEDD